MFIHQMSIKSLFLFLLTPSRFLFHLGESTTKQFLEKINRVLVVRLQDEVNSTFLWACMKAMKMGLEGLLIQNSALTIPSVTRTFTGKNMLWPITYIFCLVKDWEFCKLFSVQCGP